MLPKVVWFYQMKRLPKTMPNEDEMTVDERRKYLRRMQTRYLKADCQERSILLSEMEQVTDLHRKSLIRLLKSDLKRRLRRRQLGRTYGSEVAQALGVIAESWDNPCAERLTPNLVWMAQQLASYGELAVSPPLLRQLGRISVSTVRRILKGVGQEHKRLPHPGPKRKPRLGASSSLDNQVMD